MEQSTVGRESRRLNKASRFNLTMREKKVEERERERPREEDKRDSKENSRVM